MSLTKKTLLAELVCNKPEKLDEKFLGHVVYVKPVSEFQRSRRLASLYSKNGDLDPDALRRARVYTVIDHICEEDGTPLFKDSDAKAILELDALKLDVLIAAIERWAERREGKMKGE